MLSLFIRNLFFTILGPGLVTVLIPLWIINFRINSTFGLVWQWYNYIGTIVFLLGFVMLLQCIINFALKGRGTLSPTDPTKKLVISELYNFSRNPMYVGVMLILTGETIFFQSIHLGIYAFLIFIAFNIFIIRVEEPRLRKDFGESYKEYCENVRRWI